MTNLRFTLDREPGNAAAAALLRGLSDHDPANAKVTTLAEEKTINTFFRLSNPEVIAGLKDSHPELGDSPSPKAVFLALRELRNRW